MWQLTCWWSQEHRAAIELAAAVCELTRCWHLLTRRTPVWETWGDEPRPAVDAARGAALPELAVALADWNAARVDTADLTLYSSTAPRQNDFAELSALSITARRAGRSVLTWEPRDLTAVIVDNPALARAVLVAAAGAVDADAAAWQRSDLARAMTRGDAPSGWITYRAAAGTPARGTAVLRGAVVGPFVPASAFGPQEWLDSSSAWSGSLAC